MLSGVFVNKMSQFCHELNTFRRVLPTLVLKMSRCILCTYVQCPLRNDTERVDVHIGDKYEDRFPDIGKYEDDPLKKLKEKVIARFQ